MRRAAPDLPADRAGLDRDTLLRDEPRLADVVVAGRLLLGALPHPRRSAGVVVAWTLLEVAAAVGAAVAGKLLLDDATAGRAARPALVAAALAAGVVAFGATRARLLAVERLAVVGRDVGVARIARTLHGAGVEDLSSLPMAGLREIVMTDVDAAVRFLLDTLSQLTVVLFWAVASVVVTAVLSPPLLVVLLLLGGTAVLTAGVGARRHLRLTAPRFARLAALSTTARDVTEVERVVLARQFGLGDLPVRRVLAAHERYLEVALAQGRLQAGVRASLLALNALAFVAVVAVGSRLIAGGGLGVGDLVAVVFVVSQLLVVVLRLGDSAAKAAETATAGRRIGAWWDPGPHDAVPAPDAASVPPGVRAVTSRGLGFTWRSSSGGTLLSGVDVELRRGRLATLSAETGAGKSTLALLLTGLLPPDTGAVVVTGDDGVPRAPEDLPAGRVLYVGARPVLVPGSVRDNLLLDERDGPVDDAEVRALVARVTQGALPFDTDDVVVGPHGTGLSSGQAQLVQLARAVWRAPDVVVLDEATSSLDMGTEALVQDALRGWLRQRVVLVVSHRACPWLAQADQRLTLAAVEGGGLTVVEAAAPAGAAAAGAGPAGAGPAGAGPAGEPRPDVLAARGSA